HAPPARRGGGGRPGGGGGPDHARHPGAGGGGLRRRAAPGGPRVPRAGVRGTWGRPPVGRGGDAVFLEVHEAPERALSDGATSLRLDDLPALLGVLAAVARVGRGGGPQWRRSASGARAASSTSSSPG